MLFLLGYVLLPGPLGWMAGYYAGRAAAWLSLVLTLVTSVYAVWVPIFTGWYPGLALMIPSVLFTAGAFLGLGYRSKRNLAVR